MKLCKGIICVLAFLCVVLVPGTAFAKYTDCADSNPATQDLGTYGSPITGDMLPDGAYKVVARTTSSMCILYTNPADAEARDSKEQAIILSEGGSLTAVFYISKAYNYIYLNGTQEDAAAATNPDGTVASAAIAGDPVDGYVPHMFTIPIAALNSPITFAAYTGGAHGDDGGVWYTRKVVFSMTDAEYQAAVNAAKTPETDPESSTESKSAESTEVPAESKSSTAEEEPEVQAEPEKETEEPKAQIELSEDNIIVGAVEEESDNQNGGSGSGSADGGNANAAIASSDSDEGAQEPLPATASRHGIRLYGTGDKLVIDTSGLEKVELDEPEKPLFTPNYIVVLVIAGVFLIGIALRGALFSHEFEKGRRPREELKAGTNV